MVASPNGAVITDLLLALTYLLEFGGLLLLCKEAQSGRRN